MSITRDLIKPLYVFAAIAILICVGLEAGASWLPQPSGSALGQGQLGIAALWLLDISLLWTLILGALAFIVDRNLLGKVQGIVTLVLSIVIILWGLKTLIVDFVLLLIMVALLSSFFGWLVYVPLFAFFATGQAAQFLGILTLLKLVALVLLVVAQRRFARQFGILLLFGLSLLLDLVLSFLHALPPSVLVSVTDDIGAIVICIVAIIYAVIQLIWAIVAILRAVVSVRES